MRYYFESELYHHGILGQKWGVRRYQNPDGTLTDAGKKRYAKLDKTQEKASARKEKLQERAEAYNRSSHKILTVPGAKAINKFRYDVADWRYDRAVNKTNKIYKKISKMPVSNLSKSQIKKGETFLHNPRTNSMLEASMRSLNANTTKQLNQMQSDMRRMQRNMYT